MTTRRLGICIAGVAGAVATTVVAGTALMRRGRVKPRAMLSETGEVDGQPIGKYCQLVHFEDFVFGGWDLRDENLFEAALRNLVIDPHRLLPVSKELTALKPWPSGPVTKIRRDIEAPFRKTIGARFEKRLPVEYVYDAVVRIQNIWKVAYPLVAPEMGLPQ